MLSFDSDRKIYYYFTKEPSYQSLRNTALDNNVDLKKSIEGYHFFRSMKHFPHDKQFSNATAIKIVLHRYFISKSPVVFIEDTLLIKLHIFSIKLN